MVTADPDHRRVGRPPEPADLISAYDRSDRSALATSGAWYRVARFTAITRRIPVEKHVVVMDEAGRLTLPEETRRALGLSGGTVFEIDVDVACGSLVLRPAGGPPNRASSFTPEQLESVARGLRDSREGRVRRLSEEDLVRLGRLMDEDA